MSKKTIFIGSTLPLILSLLFSLNVFANDSKVTDNISSTSALDGRSYSGQNGSKGEPADHDDGFIFSNGMFRSTSCDAYGFESGPYQTEAVNGVIFFKAVTRSPSHGQIAWEGKVDGDSIDGTFLWTKERWYGDIRKEYWFKGKLDK